MEGDSKGVRIYGTGLMCGRVRELCRNEVWVRVRVALKSSMIVAVSLRERRLNGLNALEMEISLW